MSRIVLVRSGMTLSELECNVTKEFFTSTETAPLPVLTGTQPASQVDENPLPFTAPNQPIKHNLNQFRPPSTASSKIPSFSLFGDEDLLHDFP
ncbi:unnamed protein product, partial [Brassica oleracea]